jgi:hypothetical protein
MDYSNAYCLMCKEALPLRDVFVQFSQEDNIFMSVQQDGSYIRDLSGKPESHIWLPTETQLHALINFEFSNDHPYFHFVRNSYHEGEAEMPFNLFSSFEQYALTYYMKATHQLVWCKKEWQLI